MRETDTPGRDVVQQPWWRRSRDAEAFAAAQAALRNPMTVLALVFTLGLILELTQELPRWAAVTVTASNVAIWVAFALEYLWLLRLAPDRRRFFRTHLIELLIVVLPMLRPLRALRLLRIVAVAARSWHQVFSVLRHRGLGKIISSVGALMIVGGLITFALEPTTFGTVGDAVWWVLVTSTTVGYGDFAPVGTPARLVAVLVMVLGIGLVGVITANIVDFMMTIDEETADGADPEQGADSTTGATVTCHHCQETAAQLATVQSQLDRLIALHTGTSATTTTTGTPETPR